MCSIHINRLIDVIYVATLLATTNIILQSYNHFIYPSCLPPSISYKLFLFITLYQIKKLDPLTKQVITLAGTGTAGFKNAEVLLSQVYKVFSNMVYIYLIIILNSFRLLWLD